MAGKKTVAELEAVNKTNSQLFEILGQKRDEVFFGDTTRVCTVTACDSISF